MRLCYLSEFKTASGKFKVMLVGQPEEHLMDWRGGNYKRLALPSDLWKTFNTLEESKAYRRDLDKNNIASLQQFARAHVGAWFDERELA